MLILIRGAGDIASGIALRLYRAGMDVVMTEIPHPTSIRRTVCFSEALRKGEEILVEDVAAVPVKARLESAEGQSYPGKDMSASAFIDEIRGILAQRKIAVVEDPDAKTRRLLHPDAIVDAILAKRNLGTKMTDAPVVVAVGPGFTAGMDCHAVVETKRGHTLGRVIYEGSPIPNTGIPGNIGGYTVERVLRAPADGIFRTIHEIGDHVEAGEAAAYVETALSRQGASDRDPSGISAVEAEAIPEAGERLPVICEISGVLRGLLPDGTRVTKDMKSGDVDPRDVMENCYTASDKALAVGGGVLEAVLRLSGVLRQSAEKR
ncbi:MAG: molybdenum hydroxylase [Lachnospiraceae bacterium]|nr:molybdenum hydroxylase [Lachnospiraceae bacterium]